MWHNLPVMWDPKKFVKEVTTMKFAKVFSALAASMALSAFVGKASAATVNLTYTGVSPGVSIRMTDNSGSSYFNTTAGQFNFNVNSNTGATSVIPGSTVKTFCIDITQGLQSGTTYNVLGPGFGAYTAPFPATGRLQAFYNQYYSTYTANANSLAVDDAAWQLCLWELVQDGTPGSLTAGTFKVAAKNTSLHYNDSADQIAAIAQATTWLSGFNVNTVGSWQVYQLNNSYKQDQIFAIQGAGAIPTPLPAALPGGLALMAGLGAMKLRRRKQG